MRHFLRILVLVALVTPSDVFAEERWSLQIFGGAPFNFNLPLTIHQSGHPDLKVTGNYDARPFEVPYYYAWRVGGVEREQGVGARTGPQQALSEEQAPGGPGILHLPRLQPPHGEPGLGGERIHLSGGIRGGDHTSGDDDPGPLPPAGRGDLRWVLPIRSHRPRRRGKTVPHLEMAHRLPGGETDRLVRPDSDRRGPRRRA